MFLKRLETIGFKSFAERTVIEFVPGVTAVVGPNGSGKSNIIDAIRWVLGEQSARSLRGQKMEDIIFQGSTTRKALNFAEVSLVLNNETKKLPITYDEVNVTRRVYRSGESEFFINKQTCRLKDIVELFMDTGLGKESFSIIGQGRIDEILSSKAEERRAVFEEAAGVLKYKQRKLEAEAKLKETENNLSRVEDILFEINNQLEPLKEQAEVAKIYETKRAELEKLEIALLVTEIERTNENWQAMVKEIEALKLDEVAQKTSIQKEEATIFERRQQVDELDKEMNAMQESLLVLTEKIEQQEGERNVMRERFTHLNANKQKLEDDYKKLMEQINQKKTEIDRETDQLLAIRNKLTELKKEVRVEEEKRSNTLDELQNELESLKSDYIELLNEQAAYQNEKAMLDKQKEKIERLMTHDTSTHQQTLEKEATHRQEVDELKRVVSDLERTLVEKETRISELNEKIERTMNEYRTMQEKLYRGNEQIAKLTSRKETLIEMKENFQGFFYGVREVLRAKKENKLTNIVGAVVDLIRVPSDYTNAIDTVLGQQAQHIVVPTEKDAREAIEWLKRNNRGRATFLPLDVIESRKIPLDIKRKIEPIDGYVGIASELVEIEEAYKQVAEHLIGNVIVTGNLLIANELAQMTNRRFRIVTLDGDIVYPGGSMSGGAKRKGNDSLFTREKELQNITNNLEQFIARRETFLEQMTEKEKEIQALRENVQQELAAFNELQQTVNTHKTKLQQKELELHSITDELSTYRLKREQLQEDLTQITQEQITVKTNVRNVQEKLQQTDETIASLTEQIASWKEEERRIELRLQQLAIKLTEHDEREKYAEERIKELQHQLDSLKETESTIVQQLDELAELRHAVQREESLEASIRLKEEERSELRNELQRAQLKRKQIIDNIEDDERELNQKKKQYEQLVTFIQKKEVQASRLDVTLDNYLSQLEQEYVITFEKAAQDYGRLEEISDAKQKVQELKNDIDQLGTVNIGAINEYERLQERNEFLTEQKNDLVQAKETLYEVISEMDEEMTERFSTMFHEIQSAFTVVFKELFGGGHAELRLTDPDDLLETGVEIVARPPGKKLKTLSLLSGGERALTAIALLFAILRARPVPFCILDEVDAALDEANVARFGAYLQSFSKTTQFIVITHRKGTMEEADALYGVTMQESGVSRLVSVRLEDTKAYAQME